MKLKKISLALLVLSVGSFVLQSFSTATELNDSRAKNGSEVVVLQEGNEIVLSGQDQQIELSKKAFTMRFRGDRYSSLLEEHHAFQVAAFVDKHQLDRIHTGIEQKRFPFFFPGSDMAPESDGVYEGLVFSTYGHHKLYYEDATHKTTNLISESEDTVEFGFTVNSFIHQGAKESVANSDIDTFYLAVLYDANLNGVIDEGELNKITVVLHK